MELKFYVMYWWMECLYVLTDGSSIVGKVAILNEDEADERVKALMEQADITSAYKLEIPVIKL